MRWAAGLGLLAALAGCGSQDAPSGAAPARPIVLLIPGSGFQGADERGEPKLSIRASVWASWGFEPRVAAYGRGAQGTRDVLGAVRSVREEDPARPLCLYGESSGGTWALLAAAREPEVACVVAAAAPTDQDTWLRARTPEGRYFAREVWPGFFGGPREDDAFEPLDAWREARPAVSVALLYATGDRLVAPAHGRVMAPVTRGRLLLLPPGDARFVHGGVDAAALERALAEVRALAIEAARR